MAEPVEGWLDVERLGSHFVLGLGDGPSAAAPLALATELAGPIATCWITSSARVPVSRPAYSPTRRCALGV